MEGEQQESTQRHLERVFSHRRNLPKFKKLFILGQTKVFGAAFLGGESQWCKVQPRLPDGLQSQCKPTQWLGAVHILRKMCQKGKGI